MGMFDDLIPSKNPSSSQRRSGGMFDDLIPAQSGRHMSYEEGLALMEEEERRKRMQGGSGAVGAALASTLDGVPIAGSILKGVTERGAAGLSTLINGKSYADNLQEAQKLTAAAQDEHPYITTAGNLAGAVGGTLPAVMAAPAAFGGGTGSLFMRSLMSAGSGAGIGGADAAVRSGGDLESTAWGAGAGAGMGFIGPGVGKVVGSGARNVMDWFGLRGAAKAAGTSTRTVNEVARAASQDGLDDATVRARLAELGPDAMFADLGPNLKGLAEGVAQQRGRGQEIVRTALDARRAGANSRLSAAVDDTLGPARIPSIIDGALETGQRAVGERYPDVFRNAAAVDTTRIAQSLENQAVNLRGDAQKAVQRVRAMLNITGTDVLDPHPGTLFQTRQAIDGMLAGEANPKVIQALAGVRRDVDKVLRVSVPGIKDVDAQFAELAGQREALQRGQTVLGEGRSVPRPFELEQEAVEGALPSSRLIGPSGVTARLRQGARAEIDRIMGNNANDVARLNALIKSDGDWNRSRLATLFGQEKADRLFTTLESERLFAETRNDVTKGAATAGRQQSIAAVGGKNVEDDFVRNAFGADGVKGVVRAGGVKMADRIAEMIMGPYREGQRASIGEAITSNRAQLVDALSRAQQMGGRQQLVEELTKALLLSRATGP